MLENVVLSRSACVMSPIFTKKLMFMSLSRSTAVSTDSAFSVSFYYFKNWRACRLVAFARKRRISVPVKFSRLRSDVKVWIIEVKALISASI